MKDSRGADIPVCQLGRLSSRPNAALRRTNNFRIKITERDIHSFTNGQLLFDRQQEQPVAGALPLRLAGAYCVSCRGCLKI
jgi:hypothetical protein